MQHRADPLAVTRALPEQAAPSSDDATQVPSSPGRHHGLVQALRMEQGQPRQQLGVDPVVLGRALA
jgi:hypothetical protein